MLRWSGFLAALVSAALVALLARRTERAEFPGTVHLNPDKPLFPHRSSWILRVRIPAGSNQDVEVDRLVMTGLNLSGTEEKKDEEVVGWIWNVEIPEDVVRAAKPGDEGAILIRRLEVPGVEGDYVRLLRYQFRRGSETWTAGDASNWKFLAAYALAGGGPLLAWGIGAGVVLLSGLGRKRAAPIS